MKRLIVNADDFGLHSSVNEGIIIGHSKGIITSTSLLAGGGAFSEAVKLAGEHPGLGVGIHTTLVGSLPPVADPAEVPSLLTKDGLFPESHTEFMKRVYTGSVNFNEVYTELDRQFEKVMFAGLPITHVDGHQHMHVLPPVLNIIIALMKKYGLKKLRIPREKILFTNGVSGAGRFIGKSGLTAVADRARKETNRCYLASPRYFWGMMNGGNLNEEALLGILKEVACREGAHEIMTHPGTSNTVLGAIYPWGYHWEEELKAMQSPAIRDFLRSKHIQLINYQDLT